MGAVMGAVVGAIANPAVLLGGVAPVRAPYRAHRTVAHLGARLNLRLGDHLRLNLRLGDNLRLNLRLGDNLQGAMAASVLVPC